MTEKNPYLREELKYFLHAYHRQPLVITKTKGPYVWDEKGRRYIDFTSGLAVCGIGHNHPNVIKAIQKQSRAALHTSNFFYTKPQMQLAKLLTSKQKGSRVFFSNSGAEANECAIKLARLWAGKMDKKGRDIIGFHNSFHGRTLATTAASSWEKATKKYFEPLPKGFKSVPYNNLPKLKKAINNKTIAILLEPIQGEGGIHIATKKFMKGVADLCRRKKLLFICDEIQSGMGRTGSFFAYEYYGVKPDIITLAKGLAGGLPLAATLAQPKAAALMTPGLHGSTFGGNPLSCAASLEVLKLLTARQIQDNRTTGAYLIDRLSRFYRYPSVVSLRGLGLMIGVELDRPGSPYVSLAREKGLLINCTQKSVLRFLPPYFMKKSELNRSLQILTEVFDELG